MATSAPSSASSFADAAPMPDEAPVTSATLFERFRKFVMLFSLCAADRNRLDSSAKCEQNDGSQDRQQTGDYQDRSIREMIDDPSRGEYIDDRPDAGADAAETGNGRDCLLGEEVARQCLHVIDPSLKSERH